MIIMRCGQEQKTVYLLPYRPTTRNRADARPDCLPPEMQGRGAGGRLRYGSFLRSVTEHV